LNFLLQIVFIFYTLTAVGNELLCKFFDFFSFLLELLNGLTFSLDHLLEVIALKHKLRDSLFVMGLVAPADLDKHIKSFMLKERVSILILHLFDLFLNLSDLSFFLLNFLFILELALVVVLDDLQFLQSLRQNFIFVQVGIQLSSNHHIVLL
jgi:hypothetical protein